MGLKQQAIRGVIWSLIQRWGSQVVTFIVFLLLARLLDPQAFGLVALATVFISFIQVFTDQGFSSAVIQRRHLEPEHLDTAFWINVSIGILLTLIIVATAGIVSTVFEEPALAPVIRWLSLSFPLTAMSCLQEALLIRELRFKVIAVQSLIGTLAGGIVGVTMALLGFGVWSLVGKQLVDAFVDVVVLWKVNKWRPGFRISLRHYGQLFSFGFNVVGLRIVSFFNRRSAQLLIGYFLGVVALGYFSVAYRILSIFIDVMLGAIQKLAFPVLSRMQHNIEKMRQAFFEMIRFTTLVAFPIFLGLFALAPEIIVVVFGEQWKPSIPVMQILGLSGLVSAVLYYNDPILMAMGKPQWSLGLTCLYSILTIVLFAFATRFGIVAVAMAFVIRGYLILPISAWVVNKLLPLKWTKYCRQSLPQLIAGLVMVSALLVAKYLLNDKVRVQLLLPTYIFLGAAIYSITICVIAPTLKRQAFELCRDAFSLFMLKKGGQSQAVSKSIHFG